MPLLGIAYVPQGRIVFPSLCVKKIVDGRLFAERKKSLKNRLSLMLRGKQKAKAGDLSGGQQQQLAVGRALMMTPKVLMLDEPSLGLSPILQSEVFTKLKELQNAGMTILCVEQNVRLVLRHADRGYLLANGSIRSFRLGRRPRQTGGYGTSVSALAVVRSSGLMELDEDSLTFTKNLSRLLLINRGV